MSAIARSMTGAVCVAVLVGLMSLASPASAGQGDCAQPVSAGLAPVASDCLFILNVAVGSDTCSPECACAPKGTLPATASDALVCLSIAVGGTAPLACPCPVETTTTTSTVTTTTLPDPCIPNPCQNGGECNALGGSDFSCFCFPEWTGPTCEQCGTLCSDDPGYFRGRFLSCVVDTPFCDRPYATCPEFCAQWMGCAGDLFIDETYGTVIGVVECF